MEIDPALASGQKYSKSLHTLALEKTHQSDKVKKLCNLDDNLKQKIPKCFNLYQLQELHLREEAAD
jgi:hypothetical protein